MVVLSVWYSCTTYVHVYTMYVHVYTMYIHVLRMYMSIHCMYMYIHCIDMYIHSSCIYTVYPNNVVCLAGKLKKFKWLCAPLHQSSQAHPNRVCWESCTLPIPTRWTSFPSKMVGVRIQDCSSCPALAANQTGRVDWWELTGWNGISWQSWSEGRAWQWLDACRVESYTAGSCCWWCLEYLWVCGMGVRTVQGRHACQMLSILYAKTPLSWNESKGIVHKLYKHVHTCYIH